MYREGGLWGPQPPRVTEGAPKKKRKGKKREKKKGKKGEKKEGDKKGKDRVSQHDEKGAIQVWDAPPSLFFIDIGRLSLCGRLGKKDAPNRANWLEK